MDPTGHDRAVYVISIAAELTGVHPQTLRVYERKGLLAPALKEVDLAAVVRDCNSGG